MKKLLFMAALLLETFAFAQVPTAYCTIQNYPGRPTGDLYISNVKLGSIYNPSNFNSSGFSDYTNLSTNLIIGKSYSMSITTVGSLPSPILGLTATADFDRDGVFESEIIPGVSAQGSLTFTFTVPNHISVVNLSPNPINILPGLTRIRIIWGERYTYNFSGNLYYRCGYVYGEAEDYTVNLISCPTPVVTGPTTVCNGQSYVLTATGGDTYDWYAYAFGLIGKTGSSGTFSGAYRYGVVAHYSNGCPDQESNAFSPSVIQCK